MKSMTGYGRGSCQIGTRRLVVELRSVNHRFLDVKQRLPWSSPEVEMMVTQLLRARLERGVVSVSVRDEGGGASEEVRVDMLLGRSYLRALAELGNTLGFSATPSLEFIAQQPGVLSVGESAQDPALIATALKPGVEAAISALVESRAREGEALRKDLQTRIELLEKFSEELATLVADAPEQFRKRLRERLDRALKPGEVDPSRLAQEVAILADKADVTEELTRLRAHIVEFRRLLADSAASGRRLDFLTQELNREINTIGSKSQSAQVAARIVDCKAELERLREQIQNVE